MLAVETVRHEALKSWVEGIARHTQPERVHWCDGSEAENSELLRSMLVDGTLHALDERHFPNCYLHRSDPTDVARTEHLTFVCSGQREDAGPTNNWMSPQEARERVWPLLHGAMRGRTLYVVPYLMGPESSPFSKVGVEITDSPYVVASLRIMTRMGKVALDHLGHSDGAVLGVHSLGDLSPERRFVCHFPEAREIWSVGSGYGGNALLSKKCFALRIASVQARDESWLAEHMLVMGVEEPGGRVTWIAAAFPSACGKTNLAMIVPPASQNGYRIWTLGEDIAWLRPGPDGRLWAVNPEAGFFGVAPGTSRATNPHAFEMVRRNTIFTNVAMTPDRQPWWEGFDDNPPAGLIDWQGRPWVPGNGKAAHPNARFTTSARQCSSLSPRFDDALGVPISAIVFGGRRASLVPLVYQAFDWEHGTFLGAAMASETTAAQSGSVGVLRRDPMAMLPFCGYHMGDYFRHWLRLGQRLSRPPAIFNVNWFRRDAQGRFLWPGFGENLRVLRWIVERSRRAGDAVKTPIGWLPTPESLDTHGLDLSPETLRTLLSVDGPAWRNEAGQIAEHLQRFGGRLPAGLTEQLRALVARLSAA